MRGRKRTIFLISLIVLLLAAGAAGIYMIHSVISYMSFITKNPAVEDQILYSYDKAYVMNVLVEYEPTVSIHYVNIIILDNITGEEVYAIRNGYRAFDFHWVKWEEESYNFSLYSGDLGTFLYEYQDGIWERHILSEYDDFGENQEYTYSDKLKTECEYEQQLQIPKTTNIIIRENKCIALCEDKSVWIWNKNESKDTAVPIDKISAANKIVDEGTVVYILSDNGYVYQLEPDKAKSYNKN